MATDAATALARTREAVLADGVILCVRLDSADGLVDVARAAARGGLRVLEVTLTTPGAFDAIADLARDDELIVGGGTVLTVDEVRAIHDAGGVFAFSPVFDPDVVDEAHRCGMLAVPGAATPTEILRAHRHGATLVKVFPAAALGGPAFLRAVRGPLPDIPLVPTSGATTETMAAYFAAGARAVGVGSEVIAPGRSLDEIEASARRVRAAADAARAGGAAPDSDARVTVTSVRVGAAEVQGVACSWAGGQYVTLVAPGGMVACGIFDLAVCETFGFAVAMAHGTPESPLAEPRDVLGAKIDTVSKAAAERGIQVGMSGADAIERLL